MQWLSQISSQHVKIKNAAPYSFDWRDEKVVSSVKNQINCGSYWAYATTGNLESLYAIEKHVIKIFSEQMLIDCDTLDSGCNGGTFT